MHDPYFFFPVITKENTCSTSYISEFFDMGYCHSDLELMKERFSKLLLGEDMSGHGKALQQI